MRLHVVQCFCWLKNYFRVKHARNVTILQQGFIQNSVIIEFFFFFFSWCHVISAFSLCVFAWGFLPIAKKQMGWGRNLILALIILAIMFIDPQAKRVYWVIVFLESSMCLMNVMFPLCPIPGIFSSNEHVFFNFQCSAFNTKK